jgi:type II secretory pathway component GspD/PulD (secretin)
MKNLSRWLLCLLFLLPAIAQAVAQPKAKPPGPPTGEFAMNFVNVDPRQLIRLVYGEFLRESYVIDGSIGDELKPVTLKLQGINITKAETLLSDLLKGQGIEIRRFAGVVVVGRPSDRKEDKETIIYRPKHRSSLYLQQAMQYVFPIGSFPQTTNTASLTSSSSSLASATPAGRSGSLASTPQSAPAPSYLSGSAQTEQDSDVVLFFGNQTEIKRFTRLVVELDKPMGEVMVKAVVYEVRHDQKEGSAIDLAATILSGHLGVGFSAGVTDGSGFSFRLNGGKDSLTTIYSALSSDERFKIVTSPRIRVRSGATARLSVGDDVPILGSVSYDGQDRPIQSVEYKTSGVIFELSPKIREESVDLRINQQISSFVVTTTGVDASPTLTKRELTTELSLSNEDEVIVIGGLESDSSTEGNRGLSFFPDFLRSDQTDKQKSEILLMLHLQRL